ncbi:MAG: 1-(5-phosphoribosyl)-5-[(5-phosphoribosylamino)methylideneamino] imidazole-4-carboxamide isomerase [Longilinea sp.]|nr:1-(5-phosphoribosyl)-5-[(5-phosphoribosylamino)methylideneamino] imidazole-4-carboxamide isomerase [Longilinea sp.]
MGTCIVFPAIDLRRGQVVRLLHGDPQHQTTYSAAPVEVAERWLAAGASWLHVVNLDGAFAEQDQENRSALRAIVKAAAGRAQVQFGGGLRSLADVEQALAVGVQRVVLGSAVVQNPMLLQRAVELFGPEAIVAALDSREGLVRIQGWQTDSGYPAHDLAQQLARVGVRYGLYTEIGRDGAGSGLDVLATQRLAQVSGLRMIASGGARTLDDIRQVCQAGLYGVVVGRALYENQFRLEEALECCTQD